MSLRPTSFAAAASFLALTGPASAQSVPATTHPPVVAAAAQLTDRALSIRVERLRRVVSAELPNGPTLEHLDVQPGQAQGVSRPSAVIHFTVGEDVFFKAGGVAPRVESYPLLDHLAQAMKQDLPEAKLTILNHTDVRGSEKSNDDLSRQRAGSIIGALIERGANPAELSAVVIGDRQPIAPSTMEEGGRRNRRIEFLISSSLDANLAVIRLRPVNRALLKARGVPETVKAAATAQVVRPDIAAPRPSVAPAKSDVVMSEIKTISLQTASENPGPSPIPRKPLLREGESNWPDPPEPPD